MVYISLQIATSSELTLCSQETCKRVISKQCRPRSDAAECESHSRTCKRNILLHPDQFRILVPVHDYLKQVLMTVTNNSPVARQDSSPELVLVNQIKNI